jgi:uncharacterized protein (TIGR02231 family)
VSEIAIELPIEKVTAYEDRAEIVRKGMVELPEGSSTLRLSDITPLAHEERLTTGLTATAGEAHVDDAKIKRHFVASKRPDDVRAQELAEQLRGADELARDAARAESRARERRAALETSLFRWLATWQRSLARGHAAAEQARAGLDGFADELKTLDAAYAAAREQLQASQKEIARLKALRAQALEVGEDRYTADAVLRVTSSGGAAQLVLRYVVPCGLWRPTHEASLDGDKVRWKTFATVWQKTGEDWSDVELELSTARPSAGAQLPQLAEDRLALRQKTAEEKKRIVVQHRTEAIPRADLSGAAPGVYDGGEARLFTPPGRVTVPTDGRPHRVALDGFESDAITARVAIPEESLHVFWRASLRNTGGTPLLAGPVTLRRDGAYVGTGDLPYVGTGEEIDVSFGSDDAFLVKLTRTSRGQDRLLGKDRTHFVREVDLSYTGEGEAEVLVQLRWPKSEVKQLQVVPTDKYCSEGLPEPDQHGIVRVPLKLTPGEWRKMSLGFWFDTSGDVRIPDPW